MARDLPAQNEETYLADGVYASFDGWGVWLRAPREGVDHRIALDPEVWRSLCSWINQHARLKQHIGGG